MKVVILCGGHGTRIRGISDSLPKPMIPIGNYPILWHIMRGYAAAGFKEFVLCLGYQGHVIKEFFLHYHTRVSDFTIDFGDGGNDCRMESVSADDIDWRITLAETGKETMTGSRVKRIERYIGSDANFMLTYGDGVANIDIRKLVSLHLRYNPVVTVTGVRPPGRFGELDHDSMGRITEFNEKPQAIEGRISGGFFVCSRRLFDYLDANKEDEVLETGPFRRIASERQMIMYSHDGFWQCMDTPRDYVLLNEMYDQGRAPWLTS